VLRVTARKDQWGEVEDFICNECRFDKKKTSDWIIEGPRKVSQKSVINANHYEMKPLPVVKTNPVLQEANKIQLERETRL
jgi:NADH-quinone oxidoreductase subunit G